MDTTDAHCRVREFKILPSDRSNFSGSERGVRLLSISCATQDTALCVQIVASYRGKDIYSANPRCSKVSRDPLWPLKFLQTSWDHDRPDTKWTLTSKPPAWKLSRGEAQFNPRSDRKSRARLGCTWSAIRNTAGETSPTQSGMFPTVPRTTSSVSAFLEAVRISSNWLSFI